MPQPNSMRSIRGTARTITICGSPISPSTAHTTAEDSNTWFPLPQLRRCAAAGRIGEVARRFHGMPTNRSHRSTLEKDCPELLARCREDRADAAVLVAN